MKKTAKKLLSLTLVLMMLISILPAGVVAADDSSVTINLMATSDIHGQLYATDYTSDSSASGTYYQGLTRVATYVSQQREKYANSILLDTGDLIQGTPLTYYYAFYQADVDDPCMKALRLMDYDMFVVGNHEFNYGSEILARQLSYLTSADEGDEHSVNVCVANYLAAATNSDESKDWATWNGYKPYQIYEFEGVKVAVIGLGNPNIGMWDVPANWDGIYFAGIEETYKHYEAEMQAQADIIVVAAHCGLGSESAKGSAYDSVKTLVEDTDSIDLVISGHEHGNRVNEVTNSAGKTVYVMQPSTKAAMVSQAIFTYDKSSDTVSVDAQNVAMTTRSGYTTTANYDADATLTAALRPYETATWNNYMLQTIGTATGDFTASGLGTGPSAFVDLVNKVQIWGAYDRTGKNTPDDTSDDSPAQLSITAPLTSGSAENLIPAGEIQLGDMFRLYRYENWFYQITMSGKEVRTWLECSASKVQTNDDGSYSIQGGLTYYDVISGDGFYYEIDASQPDGRRITTMTYNGVEVKDDDTFTVVVNNYRYNGGGWYIEYLNSHGCNFTANDESRVIYSTQYDMIQGEDKGQARNLLADYIKEQGSISPTITSTWKIVSSDTYQFEVLSTTDMHGRATTNDVSTQKEDTSSMERVATIVKNEREIYGDDMIVIDNGDTIQGTLVAQYAITQETDEENPMITALKEIGYDVWNMGNHEFNFTPAQRDVQTKIAHDAGIAVLSANLTLKTDGTNYLGEETKAGESYYEPYTIKTLDAGEGRTVRVAIIGIGNAANATWDLETNYPNLQFSSLDNTEGLLQNEINKWTSKIVDEDLADIIIVSAHSGRGSDDGFDLESQAVSGIKASKNVDLLIYGHDHRANIETVTNGDGKDIYIVNGGGTTVTKNVFSVTFDENGKVSGFNVKADALKLANVESDTELGTVEQSWYDDTYAWASAPLGTFDNGWDDVKSQAEGKSNDDMVLQQTALVDLIHKAQIWSTWQSYESDGIAGATVSIASAVFKSDRNGLSFVPSDGDEISTLELSKLYRYSNNLLCAVDMTGEQLYNWMSAVADMYDVDDEGNVTIAQGVSIFGLDTFYGVDYSFDASMPAGHRVVYARINGVDLLDYEGTIRVALNSYRLSGGYGFYEATGLTEADCCWTASQYLGADRAPVPTQIGEYVSYMKTVSPTDKVSHGYDSTWSVVAESEVENPFTDVSADNYFYDDVLWAVKYGITNGTTETTFSPNEACTRAQAVTFLWRMANCPTPESTSCAFTDVRTDSFYYEALLWATENGIVKGTSETTFSPDEPVTRGQFVTFLWRSAKEPTASGTSTFTDLRAGAFYVDAVAWAAANSIAKGTTTTTFSPDEFCTRGQVVTFLFRYAGGGQ